MANCSVLTTRVTTESVDHLGRLWGAAHDGLHCYHPDGSLIGKLRLPEITANLSFGVASEIISTSPRPARSTGSESISEPPPTQRDRRYLLPAAVNLMRVVAAIDKAASSRVNTRHRAESFRGKLLVQQMFARTVRLDGLVSPSEARLLGVVALTIVSLIFISTLINPPQWLQLVALFVHLISLVVGFGSVLAVDWYGLLSCLTG